jgi:hypothetical protein
MCVMGIAIDGLTCSVSARAPWRGEAHGNGYALNILSL